MVATSAEEEDYPIFRVITGQAKQAIQKQITKLKDAVLKAMNDWCAKEVQTIKTEYAQMSQIIKTVPTNEKELVDIKRYIENAKQMNLDLQG